MEMTIIHEIAIGTLSATIWLLSGSACSIASPEQGPQLPALVEAVGLHCESTENPLGIQTIRPHLSWNLKSIDPARRGVYQTAFQILVATSSELLSTEQGDSWDSGKVQSDQHIQIEYIGATPLSHRVYYWKVRVWDQNNAVSHWSEPTNWMTGLLQPEEWTAKWIAVQPDRTGSVPASSLDQPLPLFRREFEVPNLPTTAVVYVSGLGQYELRINGQEVSDEVLSPAWTDYRKTVRYNTYDVTRLLTRGKNAIGVMLGNGMYNIPADPNRYAKFRASMGQPKLILQLHMKYQNGAEAVLDSNASWKAAFGPITFSSVYGGEDYDGRREQVGWDKVGFDDARWFNVSEVSGPGGKLISQLIPATKIMHRYEPVQATQPAAGVTVYDLGQNFAGWPAITVVGRAGARITLIPGELLDTAGFVSQQSAGGGPTYFTYTLKGRGREDWHPRFSYYGFRYVQVQWATTGADASDHKPRLLDLEGQRVGSSAVQVGEFSSSDQVLVRIHDLIDAAIVSNLQSLLTDCPHREKLGWLEQTHLMGAAIMDNYDASQLYNKIAEDIRDSQQLNGLVPDIAPEYAIFQDGFRDSPEWGSAAVLAPWIAYQRYGDLRILATHYNAMRAYVDYLSSRAEDHVLAYGLGDWFDLGPGAPGEAQLTGPGLTATAIYYEDISVLAKIASLTERNADAEKYSNLARTVRASFNAHFLNETTNEYDRGSQTANAMPLALGLTPEANRKAVLQNLIDDVRIHSNHTTAGDVGFGYVVRALAEAGHSDVLYDMFSRTDSPSYGYQLARGATTLAESWNADPASSQNHFMLGHAEEWFYSGLAGINFDLSRPSGQQIEIKPSVLPGITSVDASYDSVWGAITSRWNTQGNTLILDVTIPPSTNAIVVIPGNAITESGNALGKAEGVAVLQIGSDNAIVQIKSGHYRFEAIRLSNSRLRGVGKSGTQSVIR